jgi:hypothetical protein
MTTEILAWWKWNHKFPWLIFYIHLLKQTIMYMFLRSEVLGLMFFTYRILSQGIKDTVALVCRKFKAVSEAWCIKAL